MSPSAHLIRREGARGVRWHVRFRWRATDSRARHFMSLDKKGDAEIVRAWVMTEIANGRFPTVERYLAEQAPDRTLTDAHKAWVEDRKNDVGTSAKKQADQALATYGHLADLAPEAITVADVRKWVAALAALKRAPGTISAYRSVLRQVLDSCDLTHPNPARDPRVKLPRVEDEDLEGDPPSRDHYDLMLGAIAEKHRALLVFLEGTGVRIAEALDVTWGEVDWRDDQLRIRGVKGRGGRRPRRWVPILPEVLAVLQAVPPDDRSPSARLFPRLTDNSMRSAMRLACSKTGIPTYTPHDLRHRYTSLLVMAGVPAPLVSRIVGHKKVSVTLDTYSHVLLDEPVQRLAQLRAAAFTIPGAAPLLGAVSEPDGAHSVPGDAGEEA